MKIILASGSPRRKELLEMLNVKNLEIIPAVGEEAPHPELAPDALVKELSRCKAAEVAARCAGADDVVIGADTIVVLDDAVLGKPKSPDDAKRMLRALSGRSHTVFTGVTVIRGSEQLRCAERTEVSFRALSDEEIARYVATGEPMDKAGAYAVQGIAGLWIDQLRGSHTNVIGLPMALTRRLLENCGLL